MEIENYKFFQNPLHAIVRTMMDREDFKYESEWISKELRLAYSKKQIEDVLERLVALNLVEISDGEYKKVTGRVRNKLDVPSKAIEEYHRKMSIKASEEVSKQNVNEREFNSFCLNMDKKDMDAAKEKIRNFLKEFMDEFELKEHTDVETYSLNLQLFALTEKHSKGVRK